MMEDEKFYKFLHLPLQSGDDKVLKSMNRNYKAKEFLDLVKKFRRKFRNSVLSTDIIVGFPTENEKAFQNTIKIIIKARPDILHLFRYSKREGTEAEKFGDLLDRIKKERSRILTKIWLKICREKNKKYLGKIFRALITEKRDNTFLARLNSYKAVILKEGKVGDFAKVGNFAKAGDFVKAKIIDTKPNYLIGAITKLLH